MKGRIFNPGGARCEKCDLPLAFVELAGGKWRPCNPDGSDHWDVCRDVRYAKAREGDCVEEVRHLKDPDRVERIVYWNGGRKPFIVLHSVKLKGQIAPRPDGGGFRPDLKEWAASIGATLIESDA